MEQAIMWILAIGAVLGGLDYLLKDRFGLGSQFEKGMMMLGPTALSMAGILCLVPLFSKGISVFISPLWMRLGFDPALLGSVLAIDMGGWQLANELAEDPGVGIYAGLLVSAMLGCTLTFTIPIAMGMLEQTDRPFFSKGILLGIGAMPVALLTGGMLCGIPAGTVIRQSIPVFVLSFLLMICILCFPKQTMRGFACYAALIRAAAVIGLILGAVSYMTKMTFLPGLAPIESAMSVVSSIGVVLLGSLPVSELLKRMLQRPMRSLGRRTGMNENSMAGLLLSLVSPLPALLLLKEMDARGKVVNAAFMVSSASMLAAQLGFGFGAAPEYIIPFLVTKLTGGILGAAAALLFTRRIGTTKNETDAQAKNKAVCE